MEMSCSKIQKVAWKAILSFQLSSISKAYELPGARFMKTMQALRGPAAWRGAPHFDARMQMEQILHKNEGR